MKKQVLLLIMLAALGGLTAYLIQACRHSSASQRAVSPVASGPSTAAPSVISASSNAAPSGMPVTPSRGPSKDLERIGNIDPGGRDYDPVVLNRALDVSPVKLFDQEPRDPAFAGPREVALRERIIERLRSRISFVPKVDVSCRTSSCELTVEGGKTSEDINDALQAIDLQQISETTTIGPLRHTDDASRNGISIVILYSAALRDHIAYEQLLRRHKGQDVPAIAH